MEIQIHTDNHVKGSHKLVLSVEDEVVAGLDAFRDRITRINVHLGDESATGRRAADFRCMIEVRPSRLEPVVVTHHAASMDQAIAGATRQMHDLLDSMFGRMNERHPGAATIRRQQS